MTNRKQPPCIDGKKCRFTKAKEGGYLRRHGCQHCDNDTYSCALYSLGLSSYSDNVLRCAACRKEWPND
jgi:hypothetical protein